MSESYKIDLTYFNKGRLTIEKAPNVIIGGGGHINQAGQMATMFAAGRLIGRPISVPRAIPTTRALTVSRNSRMIADESVLYRQGRLGDVNVITNQTQSSAGRIIDVSRTANLINKAHMIGGQGLTRSEIAMLPKIQADARFQRSVGIGEDPKIVRAGQGSGRSSNLPALNRQFQSGGFVTREVYNNPDVRPIAGRSQKRNMFAFKAESRQNTFGGDLWSRNVRRLAETSREGRILGQERLRAMTEAERVAAIQKIEQGLPPQVRAYARELAEARLRKAVVQQRGVNVPMASLSGKEATAMVHQKYSGLSDVERQAANILSSLRMANPLGYSYLEALKEFKGQLMYTETIKYGGF